MHNILFILICDRAESASKSWRNNYTEKIGFLLYETERNTFNHLINITLVVFVLKEIGDIYYIGFLNLLLKIKFRYIQFFIIFQLTFFAKVLRFHLEIKCTEINNLICRQLRKTLII